MKKRLLALAQSAATALPVAAQGPVTERKGHPLADGGQAPKAPRHVLNMPPFSYDPILPHHIIIGMLFVFISI
jgi:hypothetical protein